MVRFDLTIFTLDQTHPSLFRGDGKELFFRFGGRAVAERELYTVDLDDGVYYLATNECDEITGWPVANVLERVTVAGGRIERQEIGKVSKPLSFAEELDHLVLEHEGVPQKAIDLLLAPLPKHFATW